MSLHRSKLIGIFVLVIALTVTLGACDMGYDADPELTRGGYLKLEIKIPWQGQEFIETSLFQKYNSGEQILIYREELEENYAITHAGVRIDYIKADNIFEDAHFSQTIRRDKAEEYGLITFEIPPAEVSNIYVILVHVDEHSAYSDYNIVYYAGNKTNFEIIADKTIKLNSEKFDWRKPEWKIGKSHERDDLKTGKIYDYEILYEGFEASLDKDNFRVPFRVKNIFPDEDTHRDYIGVRGLSIGYIDYEEGWHLRTSGTENPKEKKVEYDSFRPYFYPGAFGFTDVSSFFIPPLMIGEYKINWEESK